MMHCFTPTLVKKTLIQKIMLLEPVEECIWELDLFALEGLQQHVNSGIECIWELDLTALESQKPNNVINNGSNEGDGYFNGDLSSEYAYASLLLPNLQITPGSSTNSWAPLKALSPLLILVKSYLLAKGCITNGHDVFFLVPVKKPNQKTILFKKPKDSPSFLEDSIDQGEPLSFSVYTPATHLMMKLLGQDFKSKPELNFGKKRCTFSLTKVLKRNPIDYYHKTKREL